MSVSTTVRFQALESIDRNESGLAIVKVRNGAVRTRVGGRREGVATRLLRESGGHAGRIVARAEHGDLRPSEADGADVLESRRRKPDPQSLHVVS